MKCPHCGKELNLASLNAKARWAALTAEQRSNEMKKVRKKGIRAKRKPNGGAEATAAKEIL